MRRNRKKVESGLAFCYFGGWSAGQMRTKFLLICLCSFVAVAVSCPVLAKGSVDVHQHAPAPTKNALRQQVADLARGLEAADNDFDPSLVRLYFTCGAKKAPDCRALVLFAISVPVGNASTQYLAVFDPVGGNEIFSTLPDVVQSNIYFHAWQLRSFLPIRNGAYSFHNVKYSKNKVTLFGVTWGSNDSHCCPSKKITVTFKIKDGLLIPVNSNFLKERF